MDLGRARADDAAPPASPPRVRRAADAPGGAEHERPPPPSADSAALSADAAAPGLAGTGLPGNAPARLGRAAELADGAAAAGDASGWSSQPLKRIRLVRL